MSLARPTRRGLRPEVAARLIFYGIAVAAVVADQVSKAWVVSVLPEYEPTNVVPWLAPILSFTSIRNTGVAFGLFPELGGVFTVLAAVVVAAIIVFRRSLPAGELWIQAALGLVSGGALGNVVDRLLRGYVVDFIDVNFWPLSQWPIFNLADSAVVVGVFVLLVDSILVEPTRVAADA
jgi:signal peptidase II